MKRNKRGFTLIEIMIGITISAMALSFAVGGFVITVRALRQGADALLLQREADFVLNMKLAPEIRLIQDIVEGGSDGFIFEYQSPETGNLIRKSFLYEENRLYVSNDVPFDPQDPTVMEGYFDEFVENVPEREEVEDLGRFIQNVVFSYRDGGNNLLATTDDVVDDPTAIEIIDIQLTISVGRQVYQVSNSFIPIRRFI